MTSSSFNPSLDFSSLLPKTGGSYVTEVTEASFDDFVRRSVQYPVILEFFSSQAQGGQIVSDALAELAAAAAGKYVVGRINVDTQLRIAQALQVNAVPTVIALIGGQAAPLFQGTASREDIAKLLDQVLATAAANGIMGKAEPFASTETAEDDQSGTPVVDSRFESADAALLAGNYEKAVEEFDKLLADTPGDAEAIAGRAQAALLMRTANINSAQVKAAAIAAPQDLPAQLAAADMELIEGDKDAALERLLKLASELNPEDRETVRVRLLELFEVIGRTDPVVLRARRRLSGLLF